MFSMTPTGTPRHRAACLILILCALFYIVRGFHDERHALQSRDFKTVYAAGRCLLHNCDPYDSAQLFAAYSAAGGPNEDAAPFHPHELLYTPSGLALMAPFALMPWPLGNWVWLVFSTAVFVLGVALIASICLRMSPLLSAFALGALLATSTTLIMLGQPTQLTIGFCAIAVWCLLENKYLWLGVFCFAISLVIKPHVGGAVWLYFLIATPHYRKQAIRIFIVTLLLCIPGILWATLMPASSHWIHELPANVAFITSHSMPGDPGPSNPDATAIEGLQTVLSLIRDTPAFYNRTAQLIGLALLALWFIPVLRTRPSPARDYLAIASVACISLLPLYHREYDTRILVLIFPALALLASRTARWGYAAIILTFATLIFVTHNYINLISWHVLPRLGPLSTVGTILWLRPLTVSTTILTLFYLASFWAWMRRERSTPRPASI
jgi:hypothetical protein